MTPPAHHGELLLVRHGETAWSLSGQHTGISDIALTEKGCQAARRLEPILSKREFARVFSSPLQRARKTCELAGLGARMELDPDLIEWNYGAYEGLTPAEIHRTAPDWMIFRDGCPGGESAEQVGARVDRVIAKVRAVEGAVAVFAHGHILRVFAARWIGLPPGHGRHFLLETSTVNVLGYYRGFPAVKRWNAPILEARRP